jgi:hypothetical protein|tara:strand:+ start:117 stop:353 length:237 start_codon:yes stop_codon:yes gene_type:complete
MISSNVLGQIFKEHNIEVDRISKIRTLQTLLNDTTLDIPLMRRVLTPQNSNWILRNVLVNNSEHVNVNRIIKLIKEVM